MLSLPNSQIIMTMPNWARTASSSPVAYITAHYARVYKYTLLLGAAQVQCNVIRAYPECRD